MALASAIFQAHGQDSNGTSVSEALPKQTLKRKSLDPTSDLKQFQFSNRFVPSTHDVDGYSNILSARMINLSSLTLIAFPRARLKIGHYNG